jgi:hypothetical protein
LHWLNCIMVILMFCTMNLHGSFSLNAIGKLISYIWNCNMINSVMFHAMHGLVFLCT